MPCTPEDSHRWYWDVLRDATSLIIATVLAIIMTRPGLNVPTLIRQSKALPLMLLLFHPWAFCSESALSALVSINRDRANR